MESGFFITGTDTDVGKTWATVALMRYFQQQGKSVIGLKPVASGCVREDGRLLNSDALMLQEHATIRLDYDLINPFAFELPASPHLAGKHNPVDMAVVSARFHAVKAQAQILLIEGAGGWFSPLNEQQDNSDLATLLALPVIMVVAIKLGCINHAKLTDQAIKAKGLRCAGWLAIHTAPQIEMADEVIATIKIQVNGPMLGELPYTPSADFDYLARQIVFNIH